MIPDPITPWRGVLIGLFGVLLGMRILFRLRFRRMWRPPVLREEGAVLFVLHGALVLAVWAATLLAMLFPRWIPWAFFDAPPIVRGLGLSLAAGGLLLIGWSHLHLGVEFDTTIGASGHQKLVTSGPYHYIRHPLYVAFLLFFVGAGTAGGAWLVSAGGAALFALLMTVRLRAEERLLRDRFGNAYREYARRTPRFFPRLRLGHRQAQLRSSSGGG
ncbi:MAG: isoprenylcysteine carboxylmethyltransferase family protein [Myxococcales bacterium]|nr:isoprenylcysteine carboxylmethyltransferase family protein [Myxococcales bacterium]